MDSYHNCKMIDRFFMFKLMHFTLALLKFTLIHEFYQTSNTLMQMSTRAIKKFIFEFKIYVDSTCTIDNQLFESKSDIIAVEGNEFLQLFTCNLISA